MQDIVRENLLSYFDDLVKRVSTETGEWTVKGFIDVYEQIYAISLDTKVLSKIIELLALPVIQRFADENGYQLILAKAQNQYPDISLVHRVSGDCFALDIKTT